MSHGLEQQTFLWFTWNNNRATIATLQDRLAAVQFQPAFILVPVAFEAMRRQHRPNFGLKKIRLRISPCSACYQKHAEGCAAKKTHRRNANGKTDDHKPANKKTAHPSGEAMGGC